MIFTVRAQNKIKILFKNDKVMMERLLAWDANAVRELGCLSQRGIEPENVVEAINSGNIETLNYLKKQAEKMIEYKRLYKRLCLEFCGIPNEYIEPMKKMFKK